MSDVAKPKVREGSGRLNEKSDYNYLFSNARKMITSDFIVLYNPNQCGYARLGFALSKKHKKAHQRNRLKRLMRETFRKTSLPSVDVVILPRQTLTLTEENKTISSKLGKIWDKLNACFAI